MKDKEQIIEELERVKKKIGDDVYIGEENIDFAILAVGKLENLIVELRTKPAEQSEKE